MEFAAQKARAGLWTPEEAPQRSRDALQGLITGVIRGQGHRFYKAANESGHLCGWIWIGPPPDARRVPNEQYLYQITVDENVRGRGYGRMMLQALEALLTAEGVETLRLNVFHWNRVARALYDSAGYEVLSAGETSAEMCKRLVTGALENS